MPINAQRNSSNTNKPQSRQNIFPSQSHASLDPRLPTPGLVANAPRATNAYPAGAPRALTLDVEGSFDISGDFARLPADPTEKRTNTVPTQTHTSEQGRGHLLQDGEGVSPAGQSANSIRPFGMTAPRPRAQAYSQSEGEPIKRGEPVDPEKLHTAFAKLQRPPGGVRQDKARLENARTASRQPARDTHVSRAPLTNNGVVRSQSVAGKQKLVQVTLWVDPAVKEHLEHRAKQEGLQLSPAGAAFLRKAVQQDIDLQYSALLRPIIEDAIAKQMAGIATRLTWLLVRIAFDAGQTRSLVTNILGRQQGVTQPLLKTILEGSGRSAKANIMRRTPQISELINSVEQWMLDENRGDKKPV